MLSDHIPDPIQCLHISSGMEVPAPELLLPFQKCPLHLHSIQLRRNAKIDPRTQPATTPIPIKSSAVLTEAILASEKLFKNPHWKHRQ
jgi:hypothetical protein